MDRYQTLEKKYKNLWDRYKAEHELRMENDRKTKILLFESKRSLKIANLKTVEIRNFADQLLLRSEEDRKEISRELHDEIGQLLTGINYELALLDKDAEKGVDSVRAKILQAQHIVESSVGVIHRFAQNLRPMILDDLGLVAALRSFVKDYAKKTSIEVEFKVGNGISFLKEKLKTAFFRVAQEALINIERHAGATRIQIFLAQSKGILCLEIHDNGKAFKVENKFKSRKRLRLGLLGMGERIRMVKGSLTISSSPKRGTRIRAEAPIKENFVVKKKE